MFKIFNLTAPNMYTSSVVEAISATDLTGQTTVHVKNTDTSTRNVLVYSDNTGAHLGWKVAANTELVLTLVPGDQLWIAADADGIVVQFLLESASTFATSMTATFS